jgi:thioesterase domain-containing protein
VARLARELSLPLEPRDLYVAPTPAALAALLAHRRPPAATTVMALVGPEVLASPRHPPLLCVPGSDAREHLLLGFARLASLLAPGAPVYGARPLAPFGSQGVTTFTDIAGVVARDLVLASPRGPYVVLGDCLGGALAFEIAHALCRAGEQVAGLLLLDTERPDPARARRIRVHNFPLAPDRDFVRFLGDRARHHLAALDALDWPSRLAYLPNRLAALTRLTSHALRRKPLPSVQDRANRSEHPPEVEAYLKALMDYVPEPFPGRIDLFLTKGRRPDWADLAAGGVVLHDLPGDHSALFRSDLASTAAALREVLG